MKNIAFYANWAQFWGGPIANDDYNAPLTYLNFINGLDRVIYGYLMFGVEPNPELNDNPRLNNYGGLDYGCSYHDESPFWQDGDPYIRNSSNDWNTYTMYPNYCFTGTTQNFWEQMFQIGVNFRINDPDCFQQLQVLKALKPGLEVVMSFGGWTWTHGGAEFSSLSATLFHQMVSSEVSRQAFIQSSHAFITSYGFDGIDIDWEYPGQTLGVIDPAAADQDFENFKTFIQEYRNFAGPDFIITMQVSGFLSPDIAARETSPIQTNEDYFTWIKSLLDNGLSEVNMMSYDYYVAAGATQTLPNAPLYCGGGNIENCISNTFNIIQQVMPEHLDKFNLGLACYGRSYQGFSGFSNFTEADDFIQNSVGLGATGAVESMGYGGETGVVSYYTINSQLNTQAVPPQNLPPSNSFLPNLLLAEPGKGSSVTTVPESNLINLATPSCDGSYAVKSL